MPETKIIVSGKNSRYRTVSSPFQRLLIIKLGSIGDVVHTLPTLNSLRKKFPRAHISWVVHAESKDILSGHPALSEVIVFQRRGPISTVIKGFLKLVRKLRRDKYDVLLELQGDLRGGLLAWMSGTPMRLGFEAGSSRVEWISTIFANVKVSEGDVSHIIERNLNFAGRLGARGGEVSFDIAIGKDEGRYIDSFLKRQGIEEKRIVILHPGVAWTTKRWPLKKYAELADGIKARFEDTAVVLTYGPGERPMAEAIAGLSRSNPVVSCPTTLGQLIALLNRCMVMVASDTGPLHIAAALGKRVVGLYGPVDPGRNGPYGKGNFVVKKDLSCRPCWKKKCRPLSCMEGITVSEVLEKVAVVLHI